jgi:hypothetical protein
MVAKKSHACFCLFLFAVFIIKPVENDFIEKENGGLSMPIRRIDSNKDAEEVMNLMQIRINEIYKQVSLIEQRMSEGGLGKLSSKHPSQNNSILAKHRLRPNVKQATGLIPLKTYKNSNFIGMINIGTPAQEIPVVLDTGSGNLWITSSLCKTPSCRNKPAYDREKSSTFNQGELGVEVEFGTGSVSGEVNEDTFHFSHLTIPNQKFAEILEQKGSVFDTQSFSGILGLGYSGMAAEGTVPVLDTIISKRLIKQNILAFYFPQDSSKEGEMTIGYYNSKKFEGDLKYYKIIEQFYYTIQLDDIRYNGKSLGLCDSKSNNSTDKCRAVIDTGTTLNTGPPDDIITLLNAIPVDLDCKGYENAGNLSFIFNGDEYILEPKDYIQQSDDKKECKALFMGLDVPKPHGPSWILGIVFLQKYYVVINRDDNTVGLAKAKQ